MKLTASDAKTRLFDALEDEEIAKLYEYKIKLVTSVRSRPKENFLDILVFLKAIGGGNLFGHIHCFLLGTFCANYSEASKVVFESIISLREKLAKFSLPTWFSSPNREVDGVFNKIKIPPPKTEFIHHPELGMVKLIYEVNNQKQWHAFEQFCNRTRSQFDGKNSDYVFLEEALILSFKRSKRTHLPVKQRTIRTKKSSRRRGRGGKAIKIAVSFETLRTISNKFEEAEYFLDEVLNMRYVVVTTSSGSKILKTAEKPY